MTIKKSECQKSQEHFLPEIRYLPTSLGKCNPKDMIGKLVHVKPVEFISSEGILRVEGKDFRGKINLQELSIYPINYFSDNCVPKFLYKVMHLNQCLTAKVIEVDQDSSFILSRKEAMKMALEFIKVGEIVEAFRVNSYNNTTFLDIGCGISGILTCSEISASYIDIESFWESNYFIPVKIIEESNTYPCKYVLSYRQVFPLKAIAIDDIVEGKLTNYIKDKTGIFVELSPNQVGIVDLDESTPSNIVIGASYSFRVHKIRISKKNSRIKAQYCLRWI